MRGPIAAAAVLAVSGVANASMYEQAPEQEENRLVRHQLEHELIWRYFDQYLPAQGNVLEIGAATGRYTLDLARRGYAVTTLDLSETLTASARAKTPAYLV